MKRKETVEKPIVEKRHGGAREGAGRPAFEPTEAERRQVEALSGYGLPLPQIAVLIRDGIHVETLTKYFERELVSGKAKANSGVGKTLYQKAMSGDTAAAIWWSKTQMRWKEVTNVELSGVDGQPIEVESKQLFDSVLKNLEANRQLDNDA